MEPRTRLSQNLTTESKAYGYTLSICGSGALLIDRFGAPTAPEVALFVGGALAAFAALAIAAFESPFETVETGADQRVLVTSMVHLVATTGCLAASYLSIRAVSALEAPIPIGFLVVGFLATAVYNLFLLVEAAVTRLVARGERASS